MTKSPNDLLAQLYDIRGLGHISWWPLAPGWYLLAFLVIAVLITLIFLSRRYYLNGRAKRDALYLLKTYQQQY